MLKRILALLLALLLCPLWAGAELEMEVAKNYITFPELDEMEGYFRKSSEWTIVHRGNYEEHMALLTGRGESEEAVRARFAADTLLWEAYNTGLPADACFRMERFVTEESRNVWHLRHLSTKERKAFLADFTDGVHFDQYDTFSAKYEGSGGSAYIDCGFTTVPPAAYESGKMYVRYINGQEYVMTYAVYGRAASRSKLRSSKENNIITGYSPFNTLKFGVKLQPQLPDFTLDEAFPMQTDLGERTITGSVTKGAAVEAVMDGQALACEVGKDGRFTLTLPLDTAGEHEVILTVSHSKYTTRTESFILHASAARTPLTITQRPEEIALTGEQTIAGTSDPGAEIILRLDEREAVSLIADESGAFSHTFDLPEAAAHLLYVAAAADGKDVCIHEIPFWTEYETIRDGIDAFEKQLTKLTISELAAEPEEHPGERVKISVKVKDVAITDTGLGILCSYNPPKGSKHEKTPLYLTLWGYGQDQIQPGMTMTVYAVVDGTHDAADGTRLQLDVQYGTYLK